MNCKYYYYKNKYLQLKNKQYGGSNIDIDPKIIEEKLYITATAINNLSINESIKITLINNIKEFLNLNNTISEIYFNTDNVLILQFKYKLFMYTLEIPNDYPNKPLVIYKKNNFDNYIQYIITNSEFDIMYILEYLNINNIPDGHINLTLGRYEYINTTNILSRYNSIIDSSYLLHLSGKKNIKKMIQILQYTSIKNININAKNNLELELEHNGNIYIFEFLKDYPFGFEQLIIYEKNNN